MPGRRYNCGCGKRRFRDEDAALAAAAADRLAYGGEVAVYRCPGGLAWHLTSRGYTPEALRSVGRRLAFALLRHGEVGLGDIRGPARHVQRCAEQLAALGLAEPVTAAGRIRAVDPVGLARVVQVGLEAFTQERPDHEIG
jgi:hypothetical protein